MSKLKFKAGITAVLVALIFHTIIKGQTTFEPKVDKDVRVMKVINREGWLLPQIQDLSLMKKNQFELDGTQINYNLFRARVPVQTKLTDYFLRNEDGIILNSNNYEIRDIYVYDSDGKIFAYKITYIPYKISEQGIKSLAAAITKRQYFDEDGDGKFETMYQTDNIKMEIPKWIKNSYLGKK